MNTAFNQSQHLNMLCVVLSQDSIYVVESMHYANQTKNGKFVNVRAYSICATAYVIKTDHSM